jgi:gamma-glutamylcyclotransferase (GGCT)/AIG2-like uncharacterized protein YtfP
MNGNGVERRTQQGRDESKAASYPVFIYGTLKRGFPNEHHMTSQMDAKSSPASYLGDATTVDRLPLVVGPFRIPFLLDLPGRGAAKRVHGELYRVPACALENLDAFEGVPQRFYARVLIRVQQDEDGKEVQAWTYVRHPGNGGGQRWARDWTVERLAGLDMLESYLSDHAKEYEGRELREGQDGRVAHAGE